MDSSSAPIIDMRGVHRIIDGRKVLTDINWSVEASERWVVLGRNGCGKSTLLRIASLYLHPSSGSIHVLGQELGRTDVRVLRKSIGLTSAALADMLRPELTAVDVVVTAKNAALEPWWHRYDDADYERAEQALERAEAARLSAQRFGTLSSGERQRVLLARALFNDPPLLLLDEPTAALDLAGREGLVATLDRLASDASMPPIVLVTHHVEEIPPSFTHALLMADGGIIASGPIDEVLTSTSLSACFSMDLALETRNGRRWAWANR